MPNVKRSAGPTLHYVVDDYTDPWKNAPYLVLQHGNGRSAQFWYSWVPYLSRFIKWCGRTCADWDFRPRTLTLRGISR